jgi:predicted nuclease with TOPRIM domain
MKFNRESSCFLFLVFLIICLLAPYSCSSLKSENQKLKEKITDINAENDKLRRELNTLKSENSDMHTRLAQLNQQISALQREIETLQKDLNSIKTRLQGVERKKKS